MGDIRMTMSSETIQYELGSALFGPVAEVVFDDSGKVDIQSLLAGLAETDFKSGRRNKE